MATMKKNHFRRFCKNYSLWLSVSIKYDLLNMLDFETFGLKFKRRQNQIKDPFIWIMRELFAN